MKDSQRAGDAGALADKYIKESNERFSTYFRALKKPPISISRRVMKDSQPACSAQSTGTKYIKESNERFSTR